MPTTSCAATKLCQRHASVTFTEDGDTFAMCEHHAADWMAMLADEARRQRRADRKAGV